MEANNPKKRSDYASTAKRVNGAWIASVEPGSPADAEGLKAGMRINTVNGAPLTDLIAWRWEADGAVAELDVSIPGDEQEYSCTLIRKPGEDWGIDFTDVLFDGIRTCVNACQFCFMKMLPEDARSSLMIRDDDYRLSFLQGNFVTLTNLSDEDVERIITCRLEPMNVSIHAISDDVRRSLIGARAHRGIEVLERLCDAGLEIHGQIVLCAGINDKEELKRTLDWVEAHPTISSLAIVPMGYTKYSKRFSESFSEDVEASRAVVKLIEPYQKRARATLGMTRFQLSDEFYLDAHLPVPDAESYDGYPQYYDGIGMLRSFLDETQELCRLRTQELVDLAAALRAVHKKVLLVCGEAALDVAQDFADAWAALCTRSSEKARDFPVEPCAIHNYYYGGDVNVTGLIVVRDLLAQLPQDLSDVFVILPEVMFNFDKLSLDGVTLFEVRTTLEDRGGRIALSEGNPTDIFSAIKKLVGSVGNKVPIRP